MNVRVLKSLWFAAILLLPVSFIMTLNKAEAKKVKQSLKVIKETATDKEINPDKSIILTPSDFSDIILSDGSGYRLTLKDISFSGYEKEANSNLESFLISNSSPLEISELNIEITYLDLQGRVLHKRKLPLTISIPPGESRRADIRSWDKQHTYYYHRGNEPRKIATPYEVSISLQSASFIY